MTAHLMAATESDRFEQPDALSITDPRTGESVGSVRIATAHEVADAVVVAGASFPAWTAQSPAERGAALHAVADALVAREEELAELNHRETGKPLADALGGVRAAIATARQVAELGPLHAGRALRGPSTAVDFTVAEPRGVVAVITPWNDPVAVAVGLIAAAVVTGNTVVHKPSERCPHVGELLGSVLADALPPGVVVTISGDGRTGAALTSSVGVAMIAHVGSSATGARIARAAVLTGAHVIRENGGNDAILIDADVDPAWAAAQTALGAFANAGQICTSVERVFVHADIAERFLAALVAEAERWTADTASGPLVDRELRGIVHGHVVDAVEDGARLLTGGTVPEGPGAFYPATVLADCRPGMRVMREETFGPVAPVMVVGSFDEAVRLAGADPYGLAATVLTGSMDHAHRAVADLPVGTVKVNAVFGGAPGGSAEPRGESGSGFGYGPGLLDEMTLTKVVHLEAAP
ncbi:aldehyde dehydrogenase [Plantibacter sp. VKM Ac-2880]|uniref:aldehyde dehydrogenase family protein n=1 Tax=Plantibacter sp. VKM Ac-2880 TaxID=2783827 RepID=UPI0018902D20|nr:aldehyde dehydrogenase family protein [Plantibacter sp. VKM Ac-2880]MBF4567851.1 aldehyde dehydrogenase [Plantibacter sp. VKM Ac-2880]